MKIIDQTNTKILSETEIKKMNNRVLYKYCQEIGKNARKWKNRFVALLPEVAKRKLYKKNRIHSIYEFAAKVGGVSNNVVDDVLRLNEKFKEMPKLKSLIPEIGVSKLKIIAGIAKKETDSFLAKKVSTMTRAGLETYIRDIRKNNGGNLGENLGNNPEKDLENNLDISLWESEGRKNLEIFPGENNNQNTNLSLFDEQNEASENRNLKAQNGGMSTRVRFGMDLDEETIFQLKLIKQKFEKEKGELLCWDEVINLTAEKLLKEEPKREYKTRESKSHSSKSHSIPAKKHKYKTKLSKSRPIPAKKRREQSKKCTVLGCNKPATVIHHPDRWGLTKSHENLKPMCKPHHELAHRGYIDEQNNFKTLIKPIIDPIKAAIDQKMLWYLEGS